jgi:FAD/FMN-containing dehydrogenase
LAAIVSVNFKLTPMPKQSLTIVFEFKTSREAFAQRDRILKSVLPVAALDILNPEAAARCNCSGWTLALRAVSAVERYGIEFPGGRDVACGPFWESVSEFTPRYLAEHPNAVVARYSTTHTSMPSLMDQIRSPAVARAGSGVLYAYQPQPAPLPDGQHMIEHAPAGVERWPSPGGDFPLMRRIKDMFDPKGLLNRGALYGRI